MSDTKKCRACQESEHWGNPVHLDDSGVCETCRPNEPTPGDVWKDTKSTETVKVHSRGNGNVLFHDNVLARDRGPVKKLVRRKFLNRYRFAAPPFAAPSNNPLNREVLNV